MKMSFNEILEKIEKMTEAFDKKLVESLEDFWIELEKLISELQTLGKRIRPTAENLRAIVKIKTKISKLIRNKKFNFAIQYLEKSFKEIQELNIQYFRSFVNEYTPPEVIDYIRQQSAELVADQLSNTFVNQIKDELSKILLEGVASGSSYNDTRKQILEAIEGKGNDSSKYERYAHNVAVDALNTFSAQNLHIISQDLGYEWYEYQGTLIETSRDFCEAMVAKRWVHVSEFPKVIKGDFKEFKLIGGKLSKKTGLPYGMKEDTTPENFPEKRGGHGCGHQLRPTSDDMVPTHVKNEVYSSQEYKEWLENNETEKVEKEIDVVEEAKEVKVKSKKESEPNSKMLFLDFSGGIITALKELLSRARKIITNIEKRELIKHHDLEVVFSKGKNRLYAVPNTKILDHELSIIEKLLISDHEVIFMPKGYFKKDEKKFDVVVFKGNSYFKADLKRFTSKSSVTITDEIIEGVKQAHNLIIDFDNSTNHSIISDALNNAAHQSEISNVIVLYKNRIKRYSKEALMSKKFTKTFHNDFLK